MLNFLHTVNQCLIVEELFIYLNQFNIPLGRERHFLLLFGIIMPGTVFKNKYKKCASIYFEWPGTLPKTRSKEPLHSSTERGKVIRRLSSQRRVSVAP